MLIACMTDLKEAIAFAQSIESKWAADMKMPDGQFVMTYDSGEKAPDSGSGTSRRRWSMALCCARG